MAEEVAMYDMDAEFQKLIDEAEQWTQENADKREKAMKEAAELAKGKEAVINVKLKRDIANDLHHTRFVPLSLTEVLVFSGQARIATHKETRELART